MGRNNTRGYMELNNDASVKQVANICKQYQDIEVDACCENKQYVIDAKVVGSLRLLKNGGEVYFKLNGGTEQSKASLLKDLAELSKTI